MVAEPGRETGRHGVMAEYVRMVGEQPAEPSIEAQNLWSDAQKDALGGQRAVWRVTTNVGHEGETKGDEQQVAYVREYFVKAGAGLPKDHDGILALMDGRFTLPASTGEPKVFYYKTDAPVPRVMEESLDVERLKFQRSVGESTLLADNKLFFKLDGGCAAQAPEWKELRGLRDKELVTIRDINKSLNEFDELIPKWLNVVKGVVASKDLPLNVYRETLLQNKILRVIKKNHVTKFLEMLAEIAELSDDRNKFYKQFVRSMNLGIRENSVDDVETAELLRFNTSKFGDEQNSFKEYVYRMTEEQNDVYYIIGESIAMVSSSSFFEICARRVMRYPTWLTPWMNMPCASLRSSTKRS